MLLFGATIMLAALVAVGSSIAPVLYLLLAEENKGLRTAELMTNLRASNANARPESLTDYQNKIYFVESDLLLSLTPSSKQVTTELDFGGGDAGATGLPLHISEETLFFAGHKPNNLAVQDREPWYFRPLKWGSSEMNGSGQDSLPSQYTTVDGAVYFVAQATGQGRKWHYIQDPLSLPNNQTKASFTAPLAIESSQPVSIEYQQRLYFTGDDGINGEELWSKHLGPVHGGDTTKVAEINSVGSSSPNTFTLFNDKLYFIAEDTANQAGLWRYDAAAAIGPQNPKPLVSITVGALTASSTATSTPVSSRKIAALTNQLFVVNALASKDIVHHIDAAELLDSGGLISSPSGLRVERLFEFSDALYLFASTPSLGTELWRYNSTSGQIELVKDIAVGAKSSGPGQVLRGNNYFYFAADDGESGREIWRSDGSLANTALLVDVWQGIGGSNPTNLLIADGWLYFSASNGITAREVWRVAP